MSLAKFFCVMGLMGSITLSSLDAQINTNALPPLKSKTTPNQQTQQQQGSTPSKTALPPKPRELPKPPPLIQAQATYLHPGILILRNGAWEGSDHLLNLTNNIGVYVNINKPADTIESISNAKIKEAVEKIFRESSINPTSLVVSGQPPLPAFQIEILVYPVGKGFVAALDGRLFESVTLPRMNTLGVDLAFQAVTWEKKSLIVGPIETINEQLLKSSAEITAAFVERFKGYQPLRTQEVSTGQPAINPVLSEQINSVNTLMEQSNR
jgi:hypothetical protein